MRLPTRLHLLLLDSVTRDLVSDLDDTGCQVRYLIRDQGATYSAVFGAIFTDVGIVIVRVSVRVPRMKEWVKQRRVLTHPHIAFWGL